MRHAPAMLVLAAAALVAARAAEPVGKDEIRICKDENGNVSYQDDPCAEFPSKPAPAKPRAAKPAPAPTRPIVAAPSPLPAVVGKKVQPLEPEIRPGGAVDSRWATPERTWQTFLDALRRGDHALVRACLSTSASTEFGGSVAALPADRMRETADSFTGLKVERDAGPFRTAKARRADGRSKWIFFERAVDGAWKIAAF